MCVTLAKHYNRDQLDAINLWERIASGLAVSCAKCQDGDLGRLFSLAMEHIKAEISLVACDEFAGGLVQYLTSLPIEWRQGFVRYLVVNSYSVVIYGRSAWEASKAERKASNA